MGHQHQLSSIWEQRLCPVAQLCDLTRADEGVTRDTGDSVGMSCPAPIKLLSPVAVHTRCPHALFPWWWLCQPPQCPPTPHRCLADIFIYVHTYTHSVQGSAILAPSAGSALCWGHPRISWGTGAKPVPPTPPPQPRSVYLGEKPPGQGCARSPYLSFPPGLTPPPGSSPPNPGELCGSRF